MHATQLEESERERLNYDDNIICACVSSTISSFLHTFGRRRRRKKKMFLSYEWQKKAKKNGCSTCAFDIDDL